jgi:hypothetical protein
VVVGVFLAVLAVTDVRLHQYEDSPPVAASYRYNPGETFFVSFRIAGFQMDADRRIKLEYTIDASDPDGTALAPTKTGKVDTELALEDKEWLPKVRYELQLPDTPKPGRHVLNVKVVDNVAGKDVSITIPFQVGGRDVPAAESLALRDFGFLRSETDAQPMPPGAAFHPGDTVWARFEIAGYKFGPKNRYNVRYGLALLDSAGKALFSEPKAANQSEESFYPRRYLGAMLNLKLDKTIRPGEYVLALTLTDGIAGQTIESSHPFRVE